MRAFILSIILTLSIATSVLAKPPASAFGQLPNVYDAAISPDGSKLAAYANIKGSYGIGVFYIDGSGKQSFVVGMEGGVKPEWITWANDDIILASFWQSQKYRGKPITTGHIYQIDVNSQKGRILVEPNNAKSVGSNMGTNRFFRQYNNRVIDFLRNDPDHILMSFSDEKVLEPDVMKVNVRNGMYSRVRRGSETIGQWTSDLRGEVRVGQGRKDSSSDVWYLTIRDAEGREWRTDKQYPGLEASANIFGFTSDPNEMVVGRYQGQDTLGLYVYDLGQKKITRKIFHNEEFDVSGIVISDDGREIIGARYISDSSKIELFDAGESILEELASKYPGYSVDYIDSTKDYSKVIVELSSPSDPGALFVLDTRTKELLQVSRTYNNLELDDMGEVISFKYTARDGTKVPAYLTIPPSIMSTDQLKNLPFVVLPHGGPFARDDSRFDYLAQFFASRGIGVLQMNFRGSIGYGRSFQQAGRKNWVVMQEDVEDGTRWLLEKGYADPARTCIAGWSYGGYAALIGTIKTPELYACTISMAGITDLKDHINDRKKYIGGRNAAKNLLDGFEDGDNISENSPVKRAEEMTGSVFLAHGTLDQRVHFDQFKRMISALKKSDADVTAVEFKDEDHFLSNQENRVKFFEELDEFLEDAIGESEFAD